MTDSPTVPQEHSDKVGGSTAHRRINCPGSLGYEGMVPKSPGSSYANEGTALHELVARALNENVPTDEVPATYLPFTHHQPEKRGEPAWSLTIDEDLWYRLGEPAMMMFDEFIEEIEAETGKVFQFEVEVSGEFDGIPGSKGTSDVVWWCGDLAGVWDWKFGTGPVPATAYTEDAPWLANEQLLFYLETALARAPKRYLDVKEFILAICQPAVNEEAPATCRVEKHHVYAFRKELIARIEEAEAKGRDATIKKGPWCKFADCKAVCPLHVGAVAELGALMARKREAQKTGEAFNLTDFLTKALDLKDAAEEWAKSVAALAQQQLESGIPVPGWSVKPKRAPARAYADTVDPVEVLTSGLIRTNDDGEDEVVGGLPEEIACSRVPLTVAKAEEEIKKAIKKGELPKGTSLPSTAIYQAPSSGYTLTREGEYSGVAPSVGAKLAEALRKQTQQ